MSFQTNIDILTMNDAPSNNFTLFSKYSSLSKLQRIIAWMLRFKTNSIKGNKRIIGALTFNELEKALIHLVKLAQLESFPSELKALNRKQNIPYNSKIKSLIPFLDPEGLIRVGGRLRNSNADFHKKHPIVLNSKHSLTKLIGIEYHAKTLHGGPQTLLYSMRQKYWPTSGRTFARKILRNCHKCFKVAPIPIQVPVGPLPKERITPRPPFSICGTDFAGPIMMRDRPGRNFKKVKVYICIFVCFITKACHVEVVTDLTTEAFLSSFRRFVARRGLPGEIHSDNGSNFIGANHEIATLYKFINQEQSRLTDKFTIDQINWRFIPSRSPNFGGLWEANVKSVKYHLKRTIGNALLTFEGLSTVLCQIEAILNSRPLSQLNSDPNDPSPLTPSHFLLGRPGTSLPDADLTHLPDNRLSLHQRYLQMTQHFWQRWTKEYLSQLSAYTKTTKATSSVKIGDVVIVRDIAVPPLVWKIARVVAVHPGIDQVVRVATIRFANGYETKRAVRHLCLLPSASDANNQIRLQI